MLKIKQSRGILTEEFISTQVDFYIDLWKHLSIKPYPLKDKHSLIFQKINWQRTKRKLRKLSRILKQKQTHQFDREGWQLRELKLMREISGFATGLEAESLNLMFSNESLAATECYIQQAREYNSSFTPQEIYQALRNVWVMYTIQLFLGNKVACTPSVFAYSTLYPYTDNYLDDPAISPAEKAGFCARFHNRLAGDCGDPANERELSIFKLIECIEVEFPRSQYPDVYLGLQAINRAQQKSLAQQQSGIIVNEILRLTFEKGGTSVLSDALLIKGELSKVEATFFFGLGVLTQLADDLQDLISDRINQNLTLFSCQQPGTDPAPYVNKLFRLLDYFLYQSRQFHFSTRTAVEQLYFRGCRYIFLDAVASQRSCYSKKFLTYLKPSFAFPLAAYQELNKLIFHSSNVIGS